MPARTTAILVGLLIILALVIGFIVFRRPAQAPGSAPEGPTPPGEVNVPEPTQGTQQPSQITQPTQTTTPSPQPQPEPQPMPQTVTVQYTGSAFAPSTVTIKKGDTVKFVNGGSSSIWVASGPHPIHTALPDLNSSTIAAGGSYSYTFKKVGSWGYHNHLNASVQGTVVVQ